MIRPLEPQDWDAVCTLVNACWVNCYRGYVNPLLLNTAACQARTARLKEDFASKKHSEYVWECPKGIAAMLSFGATSEADRPNAFEVWRIYVAAARRGQQIGSSLLRFAEQQAKKQHYKEIVIWAFAQNHSAISFYCSHGYEPDRIEALGPPYLANGLRLVKNI